MSSAGHLSRTLAALLLASASGTAQQELFKLLASDGDSHDYFGTSVQIDLNRCIVGAKDADGVVSYAGAAYVFDISTGVQIHKLVVNDGVSGDRFGCGVSISGDLGLIGAMGDDETASQAGSAFIFDVSTGAQVRKLLPSDGEANDWFGYSVSISGDLALVGAPHDNDNGSDAGSAYVFDVSTGQQLRKLLPAQGVHHGLFGGDVCLRGHFAVIGARGYPHYTTCAAYVFDVTTGRELFKLVSEDGSPNSFGCSVSLSGNHAIIGAAYDGANGDYSGSAYVFDITTGEQLYKFLPGDGAERDYFGGSVSVSGSLAMIGSLNDDDGYWDSGSAYMIDIPTGQPLFKLHASDAVGGGDFGGRVSIDGDRCAIGSHGTSFNTGSVYIFDLTEPGTSFCFGDPGVGTPCPCDNDNNGSLDDAGCANGVFPSGARLRGSGRASVTDDTFMLLVAHAEPDSGGLYFQAENDLSPGVIWGDGLRCVGGGEKRLAVRFGDELGRSRTTIPLSLKGGVAAGETKHYQFWYRCTIQPPCGAGVNDFNASNGYTVTWQP
jgi:hypothetical protein